MSLHRIAARIAAVQALRGRTFVGDNVLDSQITALDMDANGALETDQEKPFISIYCEASTVKGGGPENTLRALVPNGTTDFLFEAGIAATWAVEDKETEATYVSPGIPATDENLEFHLDIIMRQIGDALTDPANEWAEIFRKLCRSFVATERNRTSSDERARLAAHQLKLTVDLWPDPARGTGLVATHPLEMFFVKAETLADPVVAAQVAMMRAQLSPDPFAWQAALRRYGMTHGQADALLLTTPEGAEADIEIVEVNATPAEITQ